MRCRLRTMMGVVVLVACALGVVVGLQRRSESFRRLIAYHEQAAYHLYMEEVGEYGCAGGDFSRDRLEATMKHRGTRVWMAFQAAQFHEREAKRCARIAGRPWLLMASEPKPPLSYPSFEFDPSLAFDEPDGGFR